ncbi:ABC transporter permease [Frondihabitans cladoniiphilus]|uniref:ABC transporter permease n=1 Tax=Frondihabitans cladoniiphilus TaxID=715785 RepID=A0ABP8W3J7_9MICO
MSINDPLVLTRPVRLSGKVLPRRRRGWSPSIVLSSIMLGLVIVLVAVVPFLPLYDPFTQNLSIAQQAPFTDMAHLLGTDTLGRDILSRLSLAGRVSLLISVCAVALNVVIGAILGLSSGYFGKALDTIVSGVADLQLAIPIMLLLILVVSVVGPSTSTLILVLGVTYWVAYGRTARAVTLSLRQRDFVLSPITQGARPTWVIRKHLLPKVAPQLAILASFDIGTMITISSSLDYLGLGVQAPTPTWGGMISEGQQYLQTNPWLIILPSIAIFFLVGSVQFLSQRFTGESTGNSISGGM